MKEKKYAEIEARLPLKIKIEEVSPGKFKVDEKILDNNELHDIMIIAKSLSDNTLLVTLLNDIETLAAKKIYHESHTLNDLSFGKGMLHAIDVLKTKIIKLSKIQK